MELRVYSKKTNDDSARLRQSVGKSIIIDSGSTFYTKLEEACSDSLDLHERYDILRNVFRRVIEQSIANCRIAFVGLFAKLDYCIKEHHIPRQASNLLQQARKDLFSKEHLSDEYLLQVFPHNLKATALLVHHLCNEVKIPNVLSLHFPAKDRKSTWGKFDEKVMRVIVERWDEKYIWATEEVNNTTLQICYDAENKILTHDGKSDWSYLNAILWPGAQLNLVRIRKDEENNIFMPELIIVEPDYLIPITTISGCFETYAESPFVNLINKIKPQANSLPIHLGNLAGQILDDTVHGRDVSIEDSMRTFVNANALSLVSCPNIKKEYQQFVADAQIQKRNITKLIGEDLPQVIGDYDNKDVVLEPSFFSEVLGIQGRMDFLYEKGNDSIIIEQKSGKGEFVPYSSPNYSPDIPMVKEQHLVQMILYRALFQYEFNKYADQLKHIMLLYSKYSKGLLIVSQSPDLLMRALKIRNLITWTEIMYAKEGLDMLCTLTPEKLNRKKTWGKLWENYTRPQLAEILSPIATASKLELAYYLRFMRFIENELLLSKMGNKMKENSGFASIWHDTLEDKKAAGSIYDNLHLDTEGFGTDDTGITSVTLFFSESSDADSTNFRIGDIVLLYPYKQGDTPNACAQMVNRASIEDIKEDRITLRLRNSQTDRKVFDRHKDELWAIEHDLFESSTNTLYSAMHSFLSATKRRRDLIMLQREPEVDTSIDIKGDYESFNTLATRAKQARDLFLIIGPPGTGKTSYGLVNLLKEELLEPDSNILLLSYTNRAVDEICSKLVEMKEENPDFDFIRIGSDLSCSEEYRDYLLRNHSAATGKSGNELAKLIDKTRVFCGTTAALNANMSLFELKHFNLAIIDESSQILEPHLIGLLSCHKGDAEAIDRFVLIGDHKQLPAVVQQPQDESAVTEKMLNDIHLTDCRNSLFERLLRQFKTQDGYDPRYVYMLTKQGRMHKDIAEFVNHAFYGNKLDVVPLKHQLLPNVEVDTNNGIVKMLATHRIAFVAAETPRMSPSAKTNQIEAEMIAATVYQIYLLNRTNFSKHTTVGVIVPYRNQIATVRNAIDRYKVEILHDITIDTVERYQGSQRDYIIYGFTIQQSYQLNFMTNNVFEEDGMVIDRKLNVAMTRARLNLILIGNPHLLSENFTFYKLIEYIRSKGGFFAQPYEDYCQGHFHVPASTEMSDYEFSQDFGQLSDSFAHAYDHNVLSPIKEDPRTVWPHFILGCDMDTNMSIINYGRTEFASDIATHGNNGNSITMSTEDQVLLYCHYSMRAHYISIKNIYNSLRDKIRSISIDMQGRVHLVDIGCGPATCGIAFAEEYGSIIPHLSYTGIDTSPAMLSKAKTMLNDTGFKGKCHFADSYTDLGERIRREYPDLPCLVVFNFSYVLSCLDCNSAESLASTIVEIMEQQPLNRYVFVVQQSEYDSKTRSYTVFKNILLDKVSLQKSEQLTIGYNISGSTRAIQLCYEVMST